MRNKKVFKKMLLMVAVDIFVLVCFGKMRISGRELLFIKP